MLKVINDEIKSYVEKKIKLLKNKPLGIFYDNGEEIKEGDIIVIHTKNHNLFEDGWGRSRPRIPEEPEFYIVKKYFVLRLKYGEYGNEIGVIPYVHLYDIENDKESTWCQPLEYYNNCKIEKYK
jgi:hypothetical protein